jgi:hypothetical protein
MQKATGQGICVIKISVNDRLASVGPVPEGRRTYIGEGYIRCRTANVEIPMFKLEGFTSPLLFRRGGNASSKFGAVVA